MKIPHFYHFSTGPIWPESHFSIDNRPAPPVSSATAAVRVIKVDFFGRGGVPEKIVQGVFVLFLATLFIHEGSEIKAEDLKAGTDFVLSRKHLE